MSENTKKTKWKKILLIIIIALLSLVLAAVIAVAIVGNYILNKVGSEVNYETISIIPPEMEDFETDPPEDVVDPPLTTPEETKPTFSEDPGETQPPTEPPAPTQPNIAWPEIEQLKDEEVINILLVGKDASSSDGRPRTDSMILVSINKRTNSLSMVSIMRDLYVQIPNIYSDKEEDQYRDNRINAAYRFGGIGLLNATIEKNFGIVIDGNIEVDFRQFEKIIDILGGVDIELTEAEARHLTSLKIYGTVSPGQNHLNGRLALAYCRIRQIDSDHRRTERQRTLLLTIADRAKNMSFGQVWDVINDVLPYVRTDMEKNELASVLTEGIQALLSGNGIKQGKVPQSGHYYGANIMSMQVLVPDLIQCHLYLKAFIYG